MLVPSFLKFLPLTSLNCGLENKRRKDKIKGQKISIFLIECSIRQRGE